MYFKKILISLKFVKFQTQASESMDLSATSSQASPEAEVSPLPPRGEKRKRQETQVIVYSLLKIDLALEPFSNLNSITT